MDPRLNPYAPGAGTPPPELAGRDEVIERAAVALHRISRGRAARSLILYGLRGVGKTVLLQRISRDAEYEGQIPVYIEAPEGRSLPAMLGPALRTALIKLSRVEAGKELLGRARGALASFLRAARVKYGDIEVNIDFDADQGIADSGDLEADLTDLLLSVGEAAAERKTALVLFVDELQYVAEEELAPLITALHRTNQRQLPVTLVAAGLPQLLGQLGQARSYAERLFEFVPIGPLEPAAAHQALCAPAREEGVTFTNDAIGEIIARTDGYPYFIQEWGKHAWAEADSSPIDLDDATRATEMALAELDRSFFLVRFDRLTPKEKQYMRAMAELGAGPHRSGAIAEALGKSINSVAPVRASLIAKGMIFSPAHGDTAFTVPLFDGFMKRAMPDLE